MKNLIVIIATLVSFTALAGEAQNSEKSLSGIWCGGGGIQKLVFGLNGEFSSIFTTPKGLYVNGGQWQEEEGTLVIEFNANPPGFPRTLELAIKGDTLEVKQVSGDDPKPTFIFTECAL